MSPLQGTRGSGPGLSFCHTGGSYCPHVTTCPLASAVQACAPLEERAGRGQAVLPAAGSTTGGSPGKTEGDSRLHTACAPGWALRWRPYLHPHRWANRWTGCCQLPGSGLCQDRRRRRQGSPSHCHRWTWGAWWCWGRRRGVRWASGDWLDWDPDPGSLH